LQLLRVLLCRSCHVNCLAEALPELGFRIPCILHVECRFSFLLSWLVAPKFLGNVSFRALKGTQLYVISLSFTRLGCCLLPVMVLFYGLGIVGCRC
jgi:hypothetical protein